MVGRALSSNPARSFYFKINNYLNLFMAHAKIFFLSNFCVHYPTHYSSCDFCILIWYFAETRSLQTQVKMVFIVAHSLRACPILEGKTWWPRTWLEGLTLSCLGGTGGRKETESGLGYNMALCDLLFLMTPYLLAVLQPSQTAPAARGHIWSAWAYEEHFIFKTIKPRQDIYKVQIHRLRCQCT